MNMQIIPVVEHAVVERLRSRSSFTALDISNTLKSERYAVTHREVAEIVRDIFQTGAMEFYDYHRRVIDVTPDGGTKTTQAFLYLHDSAKEREYAARAQTSLPLVPPDIARDPTDSLPAGSAAVLPHPFRPCHAQVRRQKHRRDGAFAVPKALIVQLGWIAGMSLSLSVQSGQIQLKPGEGAPVKVWNGQRVRICKRKLRECGLLKTEGLSVVREANHLTIMEK